jgi:hypothetical protein
MQSLAHERVVQRGACKAGECRLQRAPAAECSREQCETVRIVIAARRGRREQAADEAGVVVLELLDQPPCPVLVQIACQYGSSVPAPPSATR